MARTGTVTSWSTPTDLTGVSDDWEPVVLDAWRRGQEISAVGPGSLTSHLDHARHLAVRIDDGARSALDLGTGAGIPGLALAGLRPDLEWVLVDAARRRVRVLVDAVTAAGWNDRVTVIHDRAELLPGNGYATAFDVVVARLFGPPAVTAECAAPLLAPGGQLLVTEPAESSRARWDEEVLPVLGLSLGDRWSDPEVQELRRTGEHEARFPRKPGVAGKRPLW